MTARCRNVVTFRVFWEDFNTFEANQSRRGIQKWSLGGKLIYSTTNLSKTEDLYKNIDHLSKIVGFGTPEPGPVMNKFRSSKPDSELSRFVPKPRIRSCSKIIKLPVNGSMLPKYYIDFRMFWVDFSTSKSDRSRFCVQKWSLEGELMHCTKKLQNPWKPRITKTLTIYPHPGFRDALAGTRFDQVLL